MDTNERTSQEPSDAGGVLASSAVRHLAKAWEMSPDQAAWTACELAWRKISVERSGTTQIDVDLDDELVALLLQQAQRLRCTIDEVVHLALVRALDGRHRSESPSAPGTEEPSS